MKMNSVNSSTISTLNPSRITNHKSQSSGMSLNTIESVKNQSESLPQPMLKNPNKPLPPQNLNIRLSTECDVKEPRISQQGNISSSTNAPIAAPLQTTNKKTVHFKQLKELSKQVDKLVTLIKYASNNIAMKNELTSQSNFFKNVQNQLTTLSDSITRYKNDLTRSSYQHHESKPTILQNLEKKIESGNNTTKAFQAELKQYEQFEQQERLEKRNNPSNNHGYFAKAAEHAAMKQQRKSDYNDGNGHY